MDIWDEINAIPVTADELIAASDKVHEYLASLPPEDRDFTARAATLSRIYGKDFRRVAAVNFRLEAMVRVIAADELRPWQLPMAPDGSIPINEAIFDAAAVHPLTQIDGQMSFDPKTFAERVLQLSDAEGGA